MMRAVSLASAFLIASSRYCLCHAAPVTIDFDQLTAPAPPGYLFLEVHSPYDEDGVRLTTTGTFQSPRPGGAFYRGSIAIFNDTLNSESFIRRMDGGLFSLYSVDLARLIGQADVTIHFTGRTAAGTDVHQDFVRTNTPPYELSTSTFPATFSQLTEASWVTSYTSFVGSDSMEVDNFIVQFVPEPGSIALLVLAQAIVISTNRRRWRSPILDLTC